MNIRSVLHTADRWLYTTLMLLHGARTAWAMFCSFIKGAVVARALECLLQPLRQILRLTRP